MKSLKTSMDSSVCWEAKGWGVLVQCMPPPKQQKGTYDECASGGCGVGDTGPVIPCTAVASTTNCGLAGRLSAGTCRSPARCATEIRCRQNPDNTISAFRRFRAPNK